MCKSVHTYFFFGMQLSLEVAHASQYAHARRDLAHAVRLFTNGELTELILSEAARSRHM